MIVTCPSCKTRYMVEAVALGARGRTVRCFKCQETWRQEAPKTANKGGDDFDDEMSAPLSPEEDFEEREEEQDYETPEEDAGETYEEDEGEVSDDGEVEEDEDSGSFDLEDFEPKPIDRRTGRPVVAAKGPSVLPIIGWVLFILIFGGGGSTALIMREKVMELYPKSEKLYSLIGLGKEPPGAGLQIANQKFTRKKNGDVSVLVLEGTISNISRKDRLVPKMRATLLNSQREELHSWEFKVKQEMLPTGETVPFSTEVTPVPSGATEAVIIFMAEEEKKAEGAEDAGHEEGAASPEAAQPEEAKPEEAKPEEAKPEETKPAEPAKEEAAPAAPPEAPPAAPPEAPKH